MSGNVTHAIPHSLYTSPRALRSIHVAHRWGAGRNQLAHAFRQAAGLVLATGHAAVALLAKQSRAAEAAGPPQCDGWPRPAPPGRRLRCRGPQPQGPDWALGSPEALQRPLRTAQGPTRRWREGAPCLCHPWACLRSRTPPWASRQDSRGAPRCSAAVPPAPLPGALAMGELLHRGAGLHQEGCGQTA